MERLIYIVMRGTGTSIFPQLAYADKQEAWKHADSIKRETRDNAWVSGVRLRYDD